MIQLYKIRQCFKDKHIPALEEHLRNKLDVFFHSQSLQGKKIAIAVGSRGIHHLFLLVAGTVHYLKEKGALPFVFPAMGSHGGATAEGQKRILAHYGITEKKIKCPVKSSMEVIPVKQKELPFNLWMDRYAAEADGIFMISRIKPPTSFHGKYGSGLVKMAVICVGKQQQALEIHKRGVEALKFEMSQAAGLLFQTGHFIGGLAVVEDAFDQIMEMKIIPVGRILDEEPSLLKIAYENMPSLPVSKLDLLLVDEIGKNISGTGMDTNIIGRIKIRGQDEPGNPDISLIYLNGLAEKSGGNAMGIGLADMISQELYSKINFQALYENAYTSTFLERVKIPLILNNPQELVKYAERFNNQSIDKQTIIRITNTLQLNEIMVSSTVLDQLPSDGFELLGGPFQLFDEQGNYWSGL